jgi:hypothetical protein
MKSEKDPLFTEAMRRYKASVEATQENRRDMIDDQRFAAGDQWPDDVKAMRVGRPMQTVNRLPAFIDQIVGDARQNKVAIKVFAGEDGDVDVAQIYSGLIRSIENRSNADFAYDTALEQSATYGFGAWRIKTQYVDDNSFDQEIVIERIQNSLNVHFDPSSIQPDYSDAEYAIVVDSISKDEFKARWPKAAESNFQTEHMQAGWSSGDNMQIAEYWYKERTPATLYLLNDGTATFDKPTAPELVIRERKSEKCAVKMCIMSGAEVLEQAEWAGRYIPIVGVNGKEDMVDGKRILRGIVRHAKDPQRMYNYWRTIDTETKALAPKAPVMVTTKQLDGLDEYWSDALSGNLPYLPYNPDPTAPMPQRLNAGMQDKGFEQAAMLAVDEMKATTGIYSAALGEQSNETSGRAILARQREGDTANFAYIDNLSRAIRYSARVIIDLIPKIYDTERVIEIMGIDGQKTLERINSARVNDDGMVEPVNDLTTGRYDLVVDVGPSYTTKRVEALNMMVEIAKMNPAIMQIAGDLIVKSMDWDGADAIAERLKRTVPANIIGDEEGEQEQEIPAEVQQMIEQGKQLIAQLQQENDQLKEENEDKDEDRRLKQYEIDVKAMLESAKLAATTPDMSVMAMQVAEILAQNIMGQAAAAPDVTEEPEEQTGLNFGEPAEVEDGMREEETGQVMEPVPDAMETGETTLDGLLIDQPEQTML